MKKLVVLLVVGLLSSSSYGIVGQVWDLSADWSNTANPNGPWDMTDIAANVFNQNVPYQTADFGAAQTAWNALGGPNHIGVGKMVMDGSAAPGGFDYLAGDIVGFSQIQTRWTAPETGTFRVTGNFWRPRVLGNFSVGLWDNGTGPFVNIFTTAVLGANVRNNSIAYDETVVLDAGEIVTLVSQGNDFVGLNMTVTQIPEPATMLLLLGGVIPMIRRRKAGKV